VSRKKDNAALKNPSVENQIPFIQFSSKNIFPFAEEGRKFGGENKASKAI
jgi:hypothetical protein